MNSEDAILVDHCLSGDTDAFGVLVHKYQEMVYAYAFQKVRNDADAKDIMQEVFLRAYRHLGSLRSPHQFRTWLYTIMSNECKRWLAQEAKSLSCKAQVKEAADAVPQVEPEYARQTDDWQVTLEQTLAELPEHLRIAVSMFYMSDCSLKEIGEFLGVSANIVKVKLYRARQQLGDALSENYGRNMKEHKLKGGFLMPFMEKLQQIPRPHVSPTWREQMVRYTPHTVAVTLCVLIGMFGLSNNSYQRQEYPLATLSPEFSTIEAVVPVLLVHENPYVAPKALESADVGENIDAPAPRITRASLTDQDEAIQMTSIASNDQEMDTSPMQVGDLLKLIQSERARINSGKFRIIHKLDNFPIESQEAAKKAKVEASIRQMEELFSQLPPEVQKRPRYRTNHERNIRLSRKYLPKTFAAGGPNLHEELEFDLEVAYYSAKTKSPLWAYRLLQKDIRGYTDEAEKEFFAGGYNRLSLSDGLEQSQVNSSVASMPTSRDYQVKKLLEVLIDRFIETDLQEKDIQNVELAKGSQSEYRFSYRAGGGNSVFRKVVIDVGSGFGVKRVESFVGATVGQSDSAARFYSVAELMDYCCSETGIWYPRRIRKAHYVMDGRGRKLHSIEEWNVVEAQFDVKFPVGFFTVDDDVVEP